MIMCSYCGSKALDEDPNGSRVPVKDVQCTCNAPGVVSDGVFIPFRDTPPQGMMQKVVVNGKLRRVVVNPDDSVDLLDDQGNRGKMPGGN